MKILLYAERALELFTAFLLACMAIIVFINVVARYVFDKAFPWNEEISLFMFTWVVFLGALLAFKRHRHLGLDIVINLLPNLGKKVAAFIGNILMAGALLILIQGGIKFYFQTVVWPAPATQIPYGYVNAVVPFSAFFMLLLLIKDTVEIFQKEKNEGEGGTQC
ncbi:MAG: TRAP transporter small permease [Bacillota bacterium]|uniref:TRAP transporter small permease subunit n=1 Tax=Thermanaerosceptrum fracticalcis TaxID=1712410 RepID=A0A7G6E2T0_THEFR|nr:TRAP transporter small permease [Thermanaerosceptrum fracticalcis]QNB46384.1 TRAP transporter small permease subunit [Thermanaerosceptrum fracticalcis]